MADVLPFQLELRETLLGDAEFLLDLLLPAFHDTHTFRQDSDQLITLLQLLCTKTQQQSVTWLRDVRAPERIVNNSITITVKSIFCLENRNIYYFSQ